jgi:hypothetical protein
MWAKALRQVLLLMIGVLLLAIAMSAFINIG